MLLYRVSGKLRLIPDRVLLFETCARTVKRQQNVHSERMSDRTVPQRGRCSDNSSYQSRALGCWILLPPSAPDRA